MRVKPLQIHWHDKQPIYSAHFEPGPKGRLATAGGDGNVRLWKVVKDKEKDSTNVEFLSSLNRHTAAVNVVRFSPTAECLASAGDDGNIILWRPTESKETVSRFAESEEDEFERETWRVQSMMRGSLSDIYDLAWSPDGRYIISGSIDNTARIWDVKDADHHHYVQGVAWDPLGEFVATQSSDRSVHIYAFKLDKHGHVVVTNLGRSTKLDLTKLRSVPQPPSGVGVPTNSTNNKGKGGENEAVDGSADKDKDDTSKPARAGPKSFRLYHDETLTSFFRRLSFTPDGAMLLTPAGQYKAPIHKQNAQRDDESGTVSQPLELETRNTVYVYARRDFNKGPIAHLPGHKKPSVAIKCSPVLYELREQLQPPSQGSNYQRRSQQAAQGDGKHEKPKPPSVFGLDYRFVYAVATQDSILIYDTQQTAALALVSHIHYATFTDMTWSSDGCNLILTSSDGFCSIISFEEGELGTVYTPPKVMMDLLPTADNMTMALNEPLDSAASIAATAGMLQKLNGLSIAEQKDQKDQKEPKEHSKAKSKQDKSDSTGEGKKTTVKQLFSKSRNASSSSSSSSSSSTTPASARTSTAASLKTSSKTERDGDSIMASANEQPTPKKRRIQPTFVSALPGSSSVTPSTNGSTGASSSSSPSSSSIVSPPLGNNAPDGKPKIKRIQPTFVSALPGR
ncbi:hypothetical protein BGZ72_009782 [Mortierella alpina]|nr:hypothetical protein BGZ72_009782 [Mortierella alpina]